VSRSGRLAVDNPFSTRSIRPGAIAYQFPPGWSAERLVERLRDHDWQGQIVGPHGSGKSALLAALLPAIRRAGRDTYLVQLHDGQRRLPGGNAALGSLARGTVVIVDGYEQLGLWSRRGLRRTCRRFGLGLLVTTHVSSGFPDLLRTATSLETARRIVEQLLQGDSAIVSPEEINRRFAMHQGNVRELLFDLYDAYEERHLGTTRSGEQGRFSGGG